MRNEIAVKGRAWWANYVITCFVSVLACGFPLNSLFGGIVIKNDTSLVCSVIYKVWGHERLFGPVNLGNSNEIAIQEVGGNNSADLYITDVRDGTTACIVNYRVENLQGCSTYNLVLFRENSRLHVSMRNAAGVEQGLKLEATGKGEIIVVCRCEWEFRLHLLSL